MTQIVVGIDLGGSAIKAAAVDENKTVLAKLSVPTEAADGPNHVMDRIDGAVRDVLRDAGAEVSDAIALGIGCPGPLDWRSGNVFHAPNLPGWRDIALGETMANRLNLPTYVDNDANVACWGEYWLGAGRGCDTLCLLTLGTGIGGGIVVRHELLRGVDGTAAEIGHIKVMRGGRTCGCGATGCLEAYASVTGMATTAVEGLENGRETLLREHWDGDGARLTGALIADAARAGDAFANEIMNDVAQWLGIGIASLVNLLNPEKIILGGGMSGALDLLLPTIRETVQREAFDVPAERAEIVHAELGADAGVIGAAGTAFDRHTVATHS